MGRGSGALKGLNGRKRKSVHCCTYMDICGRRYVKNGLETRFGTYGNVREPKSAHMYVNGQSACQKRTQTDSRYVQTPTCILQGPTTQLAKMSIDPKFLELTADVLEIFL